MLLDNNFRGSHKCRFSACSYYMSPTLCLSELRANNNNCYAMLCYIYSLHGHLSMWPDISYARRHDTSKSSLSKPKRGLEANFEITYRVSSSIGTDLANRLSHARIYGWWRNCTWTYIWAYDYCTVCVCAERREIMRLSSLRAAYCVNYIIHVINDSTYSLLVCPVLHGVLLGQRGRRYWRHCV
jgi:hypothetical protein